jgi:PhnB protein
MFKLNPYLRFNDGKCKEAMNFYQSCLGGDLKLQTIGESPMAKDVSADKQNLIMHATLKNGDVEFFASDMMRDVAKVGDNFSMSLTLNDEKKAKDIFKKLSAGGEVFMEMAEVPWGAIFGVLTDKYGFEWMINCEKK